MSLRFVLQSAATCGLATLLIGVAVHAAFAAVLFNDGGVHLISDGTYAAESVYVRNVGCGTVADPTQACASPGAATSVTLAAGGSVHRLESRDSSTITMTGGYVSTFVDSFDSAEVTISGGEVRYSSSAQDSSSFHVSGGYLGYGLWTEEGARFEMSGGYVDDLATYGTSTATVRGGFLYGTLVANESSIIEILGSGFALDGTPVGSGSLPASGGVLTGTLEEGDSINNSVYMNDEGSVVIVPEPGATTLGLASILAIGGVVRLRRF